MNEDMNGWLGGVGAILLILACSTQDNNLIIGLCAVGGIFVFFSFNENRNPERLKRLWMLAKRGRLF